MVAAAGAALDEVLGKHTVGTLMHYLQTVDPTLQYSSITAIAFANALRLLFGNDGSMLIKGAVLRSVVSMLRSKLDLKGEVMQEERQVLQQRAEGTAIPSG